MSQVIQAIGAKTIIISTKAHQILAQMVLAFIGELLTSAMLSTLTAPYCLHQLTGFNSQLFSQFIPKWVIIIRINLESR